MRKKGELLITCGPLTSTPAGSRGTSEPCPNIISQVEQVENHCFRSPALALCPLCTCSSCFPELSLARLKSIFISARDKIFTAQGASSHCFTRSPPGSSGYSQFLTPLLFPRHCLDKSLLYLVAMFGSCSAPVLLWAHGQLGPQHIGSGFQSHPSPTPMLAQTASQFNIKLTRLFDLFKLLPWLPGTLKLKSP